MLVLFFFRRWQSRIPVAPAAVETRTFSPYLHFKISNPSYAASPLLIRYMNFSGPYISTSCLSITKHSFSFSLFSSKKLVVPVLPQMQLPTGNASAPLWITCPSPKALKTSPGATVLKLVLAPDSQTLMTGSTENVNTLTTTAWLANILGQVFSSKQGAWLLLAKWMDLMVSSIRICSDEIYNTIERIYNLYASFLPIRSQFGCE